MRGIGLVGLLAAAAVVFLQPSGTAAQAPGGRRRRDLQ